MPDDILIEQSQKQINETKETNATLDVAVAILGKIASKMETGGNVADTVTIKGLKGDKGERGERGEMGEAAPSPVTVSETPPNNPSKGLLWLKL